MATFIKGQPIMSLAQLRRISSSGRSSRMFVPSVSAAVAPSATLAPQRLKDAPNYEVLVAAAQAVRLASQLCSVSEMGVMNEHLRHAPVLASCGQTPVSVEGRCTTKGQGPMLLQHHHVMLAKAKQMVLPTPLDMQQVQQQLSSAEKTDKSDDSPVTVADYAAQAVVAWALSRSPVACNNGRLSMVAEEDSVTLREPSGQAMLQRITDLINGVIQTADPSARLSTTDVIDLIDLGTSQGGPTGRHWVLDPIDGTRGFVGMRQYSVCLGMLQDGEVQLGLLGCPNLPVQGQVNDDVGSDQAMQRSKSGIANIGALFLGHRGHGAYVTDLTGSGDLSDVESVGVNDLQDMSGARFMESWESRHSDHSFTASVAREMGVTAPPLRMDSQVKYGLLARGAASIFMRFPPATYREKIWDHCAGFVIVEEAGGKVTDAGGRRLDFSKGRFLELDRGIIAAPPTIHKELLRAIAAVQAAK